MRSPELSIPMRLCNYLRAEYTPHKIYALRGPMQSQRLRQPCNGPVPRIRSFWTRTVTNTFLCHSCNSANVVSWILTALPTNGYVIQEHAKAHRLHRIFVALRECKLKERNFIWIISFPSWCINTPPPAEETLSTETITNDNGTSVDCILQGNYDGIHLNSLALRTLSSHVLTFSKRNRSRLQAYFFQHTRYHTIITATAIAHGLDEIGEYNML